MEFLYLGLLIALIVIFFAVVRRPMYEGVFFAFLIVAVVSGHASDILRYLSVGSSSSLLWALTAFMALSIVIEKTGIIYDLIAIIIALVGGISGGAGYVAIIASSLFGALSGTAPGNAAAVGVVTIPAMKKTGFSAEFSAAVETAASSMGNIIPPSGTIIVLFGILEGIYPGACTFSQFWVIMWAISLIFILQRIVLLFILVKREHITPIPKEDRPSLRDALHQGWKTLLLPVIVFVPFLLDALFASTVFVERIGASAASGFTSILLSLVPSVAIAYTLLIQSKEKRPKGFRGFAELFYDAIHQIAPITFLVVCGFAIGELFGDIALGDAIVRAAENYALPLWAVVIFLPIVLLILGMFLEVTTICLIMASPCILIGVTVGINPILMAAMFNVMACVLGHMTPPFALSFYVSMGIAESDFLKTTRATIPWCVAQYLVTLPILAGWLPVPGMIPFAG